MQINDVCFGEIVMQINSEERRKPYKIDVLKVCCGKWEKASRDKRELSVCRELGYNVAVLAKGNDNDEGRECEVEGFRNYLYGTRPFRRIKSALINRAFAMLKWAHFTAKLNPSVISGHDISGVLIGLLAKLFGYRGKLVYDSHEFELGRFQRGIRVPLWIVKEIERMAIKRSEFVIVVNDSINEELKKIYGLNTPIYTVRSTPEKWQIDYSVVQNRREQLLSLFEPQQGIKKLFMFHGLLGKGNGIERIFPIIANINEAGLILMGNKPSEAYWNQLVMMSKKMGVEKRIIQFDSVPYDDIASYVGAVDVEFMLIEAASKSYYFTLPNKLFESIQAMTPIVASDLPELRKIVDGYDIGIVVKDEDYDGIIDNVNSMLNNVEIYGKYKRNLAVAKDVLCWENEKEVLVDAYSRLMCNM